MAKTGALQPSALCPLPSGWLFQQPARRFAARSRASDGNDREAQRSSQRPDRVADVVHRYGVATKFAVTPIRTSTGVQFRTVGLNSHWRTASTAALARSGSPDETWTSRTVPSVPM